MSHVYLNSLFYTDEILQQHNTDIKLLIWHEM